MLTVLKTELRVKENRVNGKWQLINVTQYSDMTCNRVLIHEYETFEKAMEILQKRSEQ